jgi:alkanesulfonate monooxygenase SsuD/methylene tetrahydromethanopterin reductase-like flavin-dependent oxidoreductase (luciferase family)
MGELLHFFRPPDNDDSIQAIPRDVSTPPLWMLGSTEDGAQIAAGLGVGFAFAHHISPDLAEPAVQVYRSRFKPSPRLDRPRVILALAAICAETSTEADQLGLSIELSWVRLLAWRQAWYFARGFARRRLGSVGLGLWREGF